MPLRRRRRRCLQLRQRRLRRIPRRRGCERHRRHSQQLSATREVQLTYYSLHPASQSNLAPRALPACFPQSPSPRNPSGLSSNSGPAGPSIAESYGIEVWFCNNHNRYFRYWPLSADSGISWLFGQESTSGCVRTMGAAATVSLHGTALAADESAVGAGCEPGAEMVPSPAARFTP